MDDERFTRLWTKAQPAVASFISGAVPDFRDAEELLQDVAVICLRKIGEYQPDRPFVAWAIGIAKWQVLNSRRIFARSILTSRFELLDEVAEAYIEIAPELEQRTQALRECVESLEEMDNKLIGLRYERSLNSSQIATELKLSRVNVRVMLSRIRMVLRGCIERKLSANAAAS